MRLPLTAQISTKDGVSAKNARLTNCLKETTKRGDMAVIRPGLVSSGEATGDGNGLVSFDNQLINIYGNNVYAEPPYGLTLPALAHSFGIDSDQFIAIAFNGVDTYVVCNRSGTSYVSSDSGASWSAIGTSNLGTDVEWNGTVFVALPITGISYYSTDGISWAYSTLPISVTSPRLSFGGGILCVVDAGGACCVSSNGTSWTAGTFPAASFVSKAIWNGSKFCVASSNDGTGVVSSLTSTDGLTWSSVGTVYSAGAGLEKYWEVSWSGTYFGAISRDGALVKRSTDAVTWSAGTVPPNSIISLGPDAIAWNKSSTVSVIRRDNATYDAYLESTDDFSSWTTSAALPSYGLYNNWTALYWDGYRYVYAGLFTISGDFYKYVYAPYYSELPVAIGTVQDSMFDFVQSPI